MDNSQNRRRFSAAWEYASALRSGSNQSERLRLVKALPQRLVTMGLGQTLRFLEIRDEQLFCCLGQHLRQHVFRREDVDIEVLLRDHGNDYYILATAEAREFAAWLKLCASAQEG